MTVTYRAHVNEQTFLNLPGFHSGACAYVFVEDTSERGLQYGPYCEPGCLCGCVENFEPRTTVEIADCDRTIQLSFDVDSEGYRENSLHKLDTLVAALRVFREALVKEFEPYDERARALAEVQKRLEDVQDEPPVGVASRSPRPAPTPWPRGEARACKARNGSSSLPGVFGGAFRCPSAPERGRSSARCGSLPDSRHAPGTASARFRHGVGTHE